MSICTCHPSDIPPVPCEQKHALTDCKKSANMKKWNERFIKLAETVSFWSKDRTKVGAVIIRPNKTIASVGFNGLPPGMDDEKHLADRTFKNACVLHAEENAILSCTDSSLEGYEIYVYGLSPCGHCASVIARSGIKKVYSCSTANSPDWDFSRKVADTVFSECGVKHVSI